MVFSIVTVAYNEEQRIAKTISSILAQKYNGFEYFILDGRSKDRTLEIANGYAEQFKKRGISYHIVSSNDTGVYNAMNKSLELISGKYTIFMNSGDCFDSENVLKDISSYTDANKDIIYGNTKMVWKNLYRMSKGNDFEIIREYMPFCHQSVFLKTDILKKYKFDEKYKICSDYDLFVKLYKKGVDVEKTEIVVSQFLIGGMSYDDCGKEEFLETLEIRSNNGFIDDNERKMEYDVFFKEYRWAKIKALIKKHLPQTILSKHYLRTGWKKMENEIESS